MAEIKAVIGEKPEIARYGNVLILDNVHENLGELEQRLAGTVKIGQMIAEMPGWNKEELADLIAAYASEASGKNKISFGISVYDLGDALGAKKAAGDARALGLEIKKRLRENGRPVRYVSSKEPELSSVIVEENELLASGGEFVLFLEKSRVLVGQTEAVQPYKAWSERDFGRPARDAKSGMLPPKLARLMINLAGIDPTGKTILDPFCGSGTVLMEAQLLGFETLIGTDISEKAITDTKKNLAWLTNQLHLVAPTTILRVTAAQEIDQALDQPVDVIVTETFLGTPRTQALTNEQYGTTKKDLVKIYDPAFKKLHALLKPGGVMVLALPTYKVGETHKRLNLDPLFESMGFAVKQSFLYHRLDQIVGREILVLYTPTRK